MPVIALTQEMGSLAKDVAVRLAEELGARVLRHEVVDHVASRMNVSRSLISRLREGQAGTFERLGADRDSLALYTAEEVLNEAAQGNVVLRGWGATCLLRPVPHVVCVRITRPVPQRVRWVMEHLDTSDEETAADEVRRSDQAHAARMHEQFGVTWGDPLLYDAVLNTERLSVEACVAQIRALAARPEFAETPASHAQMQRMALEARIRSALRANDATREVKVTLDGVGDALVLRGIVLDDAERERTAAVVAGVPGVASVDNQLRIMARSRLFTSAKV